MEPLKQAQQSWHRKARLSQPCTAYLATFFTTKSLLLFKQCTSKQPKPVPSSSCFTQLHTPTCAHTLGLCKCSQQICVFASWLARKAKQTVQAAAGESEHSILLRGSFSSKWASQTQWQLFAAWEKKHWNKKKKKKEPIFQCKVIPVPLPWHQTSVSFFHWPDEVLLSPFAPLKQFFLLFCSCVYACVCLNLFPWEGKESLKY